MSLLEATVGAGGWRESVQASLVRLFEFVVERPTIARALFLEVQVAGGAALAKHEEATERLGAALDSVRADIAAADQPPEATAFFVVGGIEAAICDVLAEGNPNRIWGTLPDTSPPAPTWATRRPRRPSGRRGSCTSSPPARGEGR